MWSLAEASERADDSARLAKSLELQPVVASVSPTPELDALDRELVALARETTRERVNEAVIGTPLARLSGLSNNDEYWHAFFYWFADPDHRVGNGLNYSSCRTSARAFVDISGYTVLDCRKKSQAPLFPSTATVRSGYAGLAPGRAAASPALAVE